jgi:hypothetical protein
VGRYDQECSGKSTGDQTTIEFEHWIEDALAMLGMARSQLNIFLPFSKKDSKRKEEKERLAKFINIDIV